MRASCSSAVRAALWSAAEEADLAEVDDLHLPLLGEVEVLERRPVLGAEAERVDADPDGRAGLLGQHRRGRRGDRGGGHGLDELSTSGRDRARGLCLQGSTSKRVATGKSALVVLATRAG
jgi:hypothetical protein